MTAFIASLDLHVLEALYAHRDLGVTFAAIWVSEFGEWYIICGLAVSLALWLALRERFALAQGVLLAIVTSGIGTFLLKGLIARPRPPEYFWAYQEVWYSFPSEHAAMSLAFYGFLAFIAWRSDIRAVWRVAAIASACLFILLIGFLRLYLGVHYLSDVIAGYAFGAACLWLAIKMTTMLEWRS